MFKRDLISAQPWNTQGKQVKKNPVTSVAEGFAKEVVPVFGRTARDIGLGVGTLAQFGTQGAANFVQNGPRPIRDIVNKVNTSLANTLYEQRKKAGLEKPGLSTGAKVAANTGRTFLTGLGALNLPKNLLAAGVAGGIGGTVNKVQGGSFSEGFGRGLGQSLPALGLSRYTAPITSKITSFPINRGGSKLLNQATARTVSGGANVLENQLLSRMSGQVPTNTQVGLDFLTGAVMSPEANIGLTKKVPFSDDRSNLGQYLPQNNKLKLFTRNGFTTSSGRQVKTGEPPVLFGQGVERLNKFLEKNIPGAKQGFGNIAKPVGGNEAIMNAEIAKGLTPEVNPLIAEARKFNSEFEFRKYNKAHTPYIDKYLEKETGISFHKTGYPDEYKLFKNGKEIGHFSGGVEFDGNAYLDNEKLKFVIKNIFIKPEYKGNGYGTSIVNAMKQASELTGRPIVAESVLGHSARYWEKVGFVSPIVSDKTAKSIGKNVGNATYRPKSNLTDIYNQAKGLTPEVNPLIQEAKKYKSAEEFSQIVRDKANKVFQLTGNDIEDIKIVGSTARGKLKPNDLDILITPRLLEPLTPRNLRTRTETSRMLEDELKDLFPGKKIQVVISKYDEARGPKMELTDIYNQAQSGLTPEVKTYYRGEGAKNKFTGVSSWVGGTNYATDKSRASQFGDVKEFVVNPKAKVVKIDVRNKELDQIAKELGITTKDMLSPDRVQTALKNKGYDAIEFTTYIPSQNKDVTDLVSLTDKALIPKSGLTPEVNHIQKIESKLKSQFPEGNITDAKKSFITTDGKVVTMGSEDAHYNFFNKDNASMNKYLDGGGIRVVYSSGGKYPSVNIEINKTPTAEQLNALKSLPDNLTYNYDIRSAGSGKSTLSSDIMTNTKSDFLNNLNKYFPQSGLTPEVKVNNQSTKKVKLFRR